jgi:hypothetical protein
MVAVAGVRRGGGARGRGAQLAEVVAVVDLVVV